MHRARDRSRSAQPTRPAYAVLLGLLSAGLLGGVLAGCDVPTEQADAPAGASTASSRPSSPSSPGSPEPPSAPPPYAPPSEPVASPSSAAPSLDDWVVGARPLPLRPDGFGKVLPTPAELRVRRLPTRDLLPPPEDGRFHGTIDPISRAVRRRMGESWSAACPVGLQDLRYLRVSFWGFDRRPHTGELVVNARVSRDVVGVFRRLYRARFPIEEMRLVTTADLEAAPTGDGNNTAGLVCRAARGQTEWSAHAYGLAIDLNPFMNPYQRDDLVLPELASAYLDRAWRRPGMVHPGGVAFEAFQDIGWSWGGDFRSLTDRMHFTATGR